MSLRCIAFILVMNIPFPSLAEDIFVLGEVHDNPGHHAVQAERIAKLRPRAIVFEMLTEAQAARVTPDLRGNKTALAEHLGWEESGWPDFAMYYPLFTAAPDASIYGAQVPRDAARAVLDRGLATSFGDEAARYGLDRPLPPDELALREALQREAHCNALPEEILPGMVAVQRLRDAVLTRAAVQAMDETGGPVAVITGNGHARRDWGVPSYLANVAPDLKLWVLGQTEDGQELDGGFDEVLSSPAVNRPDPCAAFN